MHAILHFKNNLGQKALVDYPGQNAHEISKIAKEVYLGGGKLTLITWGYPTRCPECNIITGVSTTQNSSVMCCVCAREYDKKETEKALNIKH